MTMAGLRSVIRRSLPKPFIQELMRSIRSHVLITRWRCQLSSISGRLTVPAACPYQSCPLSADRGYGYGWFIGGTGRARLANQSGSVLGFWAYNGFYPVRDIVVVVVANLDTVAINPISAQLNLLAVGGPPAPRS